MYCGTCNADDASVVRIKFDAKYGKLECCDKCGDAKAAYAGQPDVYVGGNGGVQTDMNLHDPKTKRPIPFSSKREKAAIMKRLGVECAISAERQHGAREVSKKAKYYSV